ncbi:cytidine deaminase-like fold-containing protein [Pseudomonas fakonensis]|uniref:cytidine deaminase-like fold-containing protein n=1 Tax=Pseudomonas fakonensis TaxID=2842355 RepID=UPI003F59C58D
MPKIRGCKRHFSSCHCRGGNRGAAFTDVNQTAHPIAQANPDELTLIADRVATKIEATGKPLPNGNMADAHAEIRVIQQAYNAGKIRGADMAMGVAGKYVCGFCKDDIAVAAERPD